VWLVNKPQAANTDNRSYGRLSLIFAGVIRVFVDSLLERNGFDPSVPR
jgi:hypothetical protein